jgi:uncharacterized protein (TIGR02118 family)
MARLVVLYKTPADARAFDHHYRAIHIPLAKKLPGLRRYEISQGPVMTPAGPAGVHLVATLYFDDMQAIQAAFASPEGQAAAADAQSLTELEMFIFETQEV